MSSADEREQSGNDEQGIGSRRTRRALVRAIGAVIVLDVIAFFVVPPPAADPAAGFQFPRDAISLNLEAIAPHVVFELVPGNPTFTISSTILTAWLVMVMILMGAIVATRRLRELPGGFQNVVEWMYEGLEGFAMSVGGQHARRYVPLFVGLFVFIMFSNWTGLIPIVGRVEFLRAPTSDVNVTFGLALVSFVTFHIEGVRALGVTGYLGKFFNFRGFRRSLFDGVIDLFVGVLEFFLEFFKPVTLALRLFANIYGGELVLGVMTGLLIAVVPVVFLGLELFVGFMQALVFSLLTLMFTLIAIEGHQDEETATAPTHEPADRAYPRTAIDRGPAAPEAA